MQDISWSVLMLVNKRAESKLYAEKNFHVDEIRLRKAKAKPNRAHIINVTRKIIQQQMYKMLM